MGQYTHSSLKVKQKKTTFVISFLLIMLSFYIMDFHPPFKYALHFALSAVQYSNSIKISHTFCCKRLPDIASYPHVWGFRLGFLDLRSIRSHVLDRPVIISSYPIPLPQIAVWPKHSFSGLFYLIHSFR